MPYTNKVNADGLNKPFSSRLRGLMEELKCTQKELGEAIGVTYQAIGAYRDGKALPGLEVAQKIAKKLANNELSPCSFSMKCFKYDALLMVDQNYKHNILDEIRVQYKKMLDAGDTTVWETANDEFDEAGSKCHGWSSIPIYYYHKFFT